MSVSRKNKSMKKTSKTIKRSSRNVMKGGKNVFSKLAFWRTKKEKSNLFFEFTFRLLVCRVLLHGNEKIFLCIHVKFNGLLVLSFYKSVRAIIYFNIIISSL